ncbi:MAG: hypothetical protein JW915_24565 [Chitinispirillaceae bacterium]|nr:hypothetical protein [Chitinispirillaceae bacterium]
MNKGIVSKVLNRTYSFPNSKSEIELLRNASKNNGSESITDFQYYMAVFNICMEFTEQVLDSNPMLNDFNNMIYDKQEEYMPSGPPMSPITKSFFNSWMALDALINNKLTLGLLFSRYIQEKKVMRYAAKAMDNLNDSFVSLYQVVGGDLKKTFLWNLIEKREIEASIPIYDYSVATYSPAIGEIWYARILPPLNQEQNIHTIFGTPLVFRHTNREDWERYLARRIAGGDKNVEELKMHLKYGESFGYWMEFVFQVYSNHTREVIYAEGLPDIKDSRPHGRLDGGRMCEAVDAQDQLDLPFKSESSIWFPLELAMALKGMKPGSCSTGSVCHKGEIIPVIAGCFKRDDMVFLGVEPGPPEYVDTKFRYLDNSGGDELLEVCLFFKNDRILAFDFDPVFIPVKRWLSEVLAVKQYGFCFYNHEDKRYTISFTSVEPEDEPWLIRNNLRAKKLVRNNFKRLMDASKLKDRITVKGKKSNCIGVGENQDYFINDDSKLIAIEDINKL